MDNFWLYVLLVVFGISIVVSAINYFARATKLVKWNKGAELNKRFSEEEIFEILQKVQYPLKKRVYYSENGKLMVETKYYEFPVELSENDQGNTRIQFVVDWSQLKTSFNRITRMFNNVKNHRIENAMIDMYCYTMQEVDQSINAAKVYKGHVLRSMIMVLLVVLMVVAGIGLICSTTNGYVEMVQDGYTETYPDITFGEALEGYYSENKQWDYFLTQTDMKMVEFTGQAPSELGGEQICIQFEISIHGDEFSVYALELDGQVCTESEIQQVLTYLFLIKQGDEQTVYDMTGVDTFEDGMVGLLEEEEVLLQDTDDLEWVEGDGYEYYTSEQILDTCADIYGAARYVFYDINSDGDLELIVNYGEIEAEMVTEVYDSTFGDEDYYYCGSLDGTMMLYAAEDGNGIYAVKGKQGVEWIYRITLDSGFLYEELLSEKELAYDEEYYANDMPIYFMEY